MSFTRAKPARTATAAATTPESKPQIRCTGHNRVCKRQIAGPLAKNAGRAFYTCPLGRDDPNRCKYFKFEDELIDAVVRSSQTSHASEGSPRRGGQVLGGGSASRTLGRSPEAKLGRPLARSSSNHADSLAAAAKGKDKDKDTMVSTQEADTLEELLSSDTGEAYEGVSDIDPADDDEIDWASVDADMIESNAVGRVTPRHQRTLHIIPSSGTSLTPAIVIGERLREAASAPPGKRKRESLATIVGEPTPKRSGTANPFLDDDAPSEITAGTETPFPPPAALTPGTGATASPSAAHRFLSSRPAHAALQPLLESIDGLQETLARQDRLLRAADSMKRSMRESIRNLQARVAELEAELAQARARNA